METMVNDKKFYDKDDFASKSVGGTALGLSIGALGLELLRNGGIQNVLGGITGGKDVPFEESAFGLYKNQRDQYDELAKAIADINTKLAVDAAAQQWKDKAIYDAIALESERRACNDGKIVNYVNSTFVPHYISEFTVGTGTTQSAIYNPLCNCNCNPLM